ncbi:hypothetical protein GPECTOR_18phG15 [Gonium pectorale]|uniref:Pherophorin domain-containing protein n=1 Tax=Gonium pectorale TaxID=33097 RepID=A0A150GJY1_GONPE|nr:hypothetical protein GPECTOR_18phG15 [Gonium pectorale]|eukprot:KXZ50126.1 hypothetical protein GPECTOR_18phG15 [Gonium pectorale]
MARQGPLLAALVGLLCLSVAQARKAGPTALKFPSLTSCSQNADATTFRISTNVTKSMPGQTYCFTFGTAAPANATLPCGKATVLERVQLWASHEDRRKISMIRIREPSGDKVIYGSWTRKAAGYADEIVFSKLQWTPEYIKTVNPRLCLTLAADTTLDDICLGTAGLCTFGLYSVGANGAKCCPVYDVPAKVAA